MEVMKLANETKIKKNKIFLRVHINHYHARISTKQMTFFFHDTLADPRVQECSPLDNNGGDKKVVGYHTESIFLQESHQETETEKHHHVNILKLYVRDM